MTESILFVDDTPEALRVFERLFGDEYAVHTAASAAEGLEACRSRGPFAVVISDYEMPGRRGGEFLARVHEGWPETVTMLLTGIVEVDVAIEALHAGRIFRFLEKPCPREVIAEALREGLGEYRKRREQRTRTTQLDFTRECLEQFNGELESRISEQTRALVRLNRFLNDLNACDTVEQVAATTAEAASQVCGGRPVRLHLAQRPDGSERSEHCIGEPSTATHVQAIATTEGELGAIAVELRDAAGQTLTQTQVDILASVSASAAAAARNAIRRSERDDAHEATIFALAKLAEQRDNETGKHLERVSAYSRLIAEGLRSDGWLRDVITDAWIEVLVKSAPLHDIGKVGIADEILMKPGKLTPAEWTVMKRHAEIGAETLRSVLRSGTRQPFLQMSLDIAWCHHEKWGGGGYPRGLVGEAIPLSARIVALADVYDALTSERPYKHAWSHEQALGWILNGSGGHFDPRIVDAFVQRAEQADEIRARLADSKEDLLRVGPQRAPVIVGAQRSSA